MQFQKIGTGIIGLNISTWLYAGDGSNAENIGLWIALIALAVVGLLILFFSSRQSRKLQELHQALFDKQLEMEKTKIFF
ncbi:MAG: hypothetical protein FAF03_07830 [Epsilonproteobacteria bacterium]|nr:hypothetical protein [Campylobacterota bacterium]